MIHPDTELAFISPAVGRGVRATRFLPKGTIVWALCELDLVLPPEDVTALGQVYQPIFDKYAYVDPAGRSILCWDHARFINHACRPSVRGAHPHFQIVTRDVEAGEELTCEYAECNVEPAMECLCDAPDCRSAISGKDLIRYGEAWDQEVLDAVKAIGQVDQPLWKFLRDPELAREISTGRRPPMKMRDYYAFGAKDGANAAASRPSEPRIRERAHATKRANCT
jgi:hypothetical protein